ncbi:MAG: dethiobiotin synthase [Burkholderiales bacterium]
MTRGIFVTGTDTGVGKTRVACALLAALVHERVRAVGMKPVASGVAPGAPCNEDVAALAAADGLAVAQRDRNPYAFAPAIAPHVAAREAGVAIDLGAIARAFATLARDAEVIVVEGAGGARVPLGTALDMLDLPRRLRLPVLLVVGLRLGCISHALLTADAVAARGLVLAGWVANRIDPAMERADDSVEALAERLPAPLVADVPFGGEAIFTRRDCARLGLVSRAVLPHA